MRSEKETSKNVQNRAPLDINRKFYVHFNSTDKESGGLNMRKTLQLGFGLILAALISTSPIGPAQAYISSYSWIAPFYRGYDEFYGTYVVAYKTGSTAQLLVGVYNDWYGYPNITVTAVKVWFDWNINYSSTEVPYVMQLYDYHNFMINFTVPSTDVASNMMRHMYMIYVEFSYDTYKSYWSYYPYESFAVYSVDQADVLDLYTKYQAYYNAYPSYYFTSVEARLLAGQATVEAYTGRTYYMRGDFVGAKTQYQTALDLYGQAIAAEREWGTTYQEAQLNVTLINAEASLAQANAAKAQAEAAMIEANAAMIEANATKTQAEAAMIEANAAMTQSYAWMLFGVAAILFGVAAVVYAIRKPKM
jgi:hypothetical protein